MTLNCKGQLLDVNVPKIMGILNNTPDSFFDGGMHKDMDAVLRKVEGMLLVAIAPGPMPILFLRRRSCNG